MGKGDQMNENELGNKVVTPFSRLLEACEALLEGIRLIGHSRWQTYSQGPDYDGSGEDWRYCIEPCIMGPYDLVQAAIVEGLFEERETETLVDASLEMLKELFQDESLSATMIRITGSSLVSLMLASIRGENTGGKDGIEWGSKFLSNLPRETCNE